MKRTDRFGVWTILVLCCAFLWPAFASASNPSKPDRDLTSSFIPSSYSPRLAQDPFRPCAGVILTNRTARDVWATASTPVGGDPPCQYSVIVLESRTSSSEFFDVEALWVRCDNLETGCERGRRPFKLGACSNCIITEEGGTLHLAGSTFCSTSCGWVTKGHGWPDPTTEIPWPEPGEASLLPNLDTSQFSCQPTPFTSGDCLLTRPSVITRCSVPNDQFCAEYYNNTSLTGNPVFTRNENHINYDWGGGGPGNGVNNDDFSVRWTGRFNFPNGGNYTFRAFTDDGMRIYVDGALVVDVWWPQPPTTHQGVKFLNAGEHEVKVEYNEYGGGATAQVSWQQETGVCPTINAWKGEYWSGYFNGSPTVCRNDSNLNFDWGRGSPDPRIPSDNFTARWTRTLNFDAGRYRFHLAGDDGFSLRVDGRVVIDQWIYQPRTEYTGEIDLSGGSHELKVEYFEGEWDANISLWWEGPINASPPGSSIDPSKSYRIIAVHSGKALDVTAASPSDGARVQQWAYGGGANQKWRFESTGDGYYMIRAVHSNKCLDVEAASPNDGALVQQWTCAAANNQRWSITPVGNSFVIQAKHSGKALDVRGALQDNGAAVHQWSYGGGANQRWLIEAVP